MLMRKSEKERDLKHGSLAFSFLFLSFREKREECERLHKSRVAKNI